MNYNYDDIIKFLEDLDFECKYNTDKYGILYEKDNYRFKVKSDGMLDKVYFRKGNEDHEKVTNAFLLQMHTHKDIMYFFNTYAIPFLKPVIRKKKLEKVMKLL